MNKAFEKKKNKTPPNIPSGKKKKSLSEKSVHQIFDLSKSVITDNFQHVNPSAGIFFRWNSKVYTIKRAISEIEDACDLLDKYFEELLKRAD